MGQILLGDPSNSWYRDISDGDSYSISAKTLEPWTLEILFVHVFFFCYHYEINSRLFILFSWGAAQKQGR